MNASPRFRLPQLPLVASLVTVLVLAGCSSSGRTSGSDPFSGGGGGDRPQGRAGQLRVQVQNQNFNEATITARGPGVRRRLGRIGGAESRTFTLPWSTANRLYFEVDLLGGDDCVTNAVDVSPGETVRLVIDSVARVRGDGFRRLCELRRAR